MQAAELRPGEHVPSVAGGAGTVGSITWLRGADRMYDLTVDTAHTFYVGAGGWLVHNRDCKPRDHHVRSERAARRQAFRDHGIPTSTGGRPFTRVRLYGKNPNLRGRRGEPYEEIRVPGRPSIKHHSNGHTFPNRQAPGHYHGRSDRHIYYGNLR